MAGSRKSFHPAQPLSRSHMPAGFDISLANYTNGRTVRVPEDYGRKQPLSGFDGYRNVVDYIVRITHRIWESGDHKGAPRDVEYIDACYAPDSLVYDDYGLQTGNAKIIADTYHTTGAFPDIVLDAEEVIWAGNDRIGFHTSHLTRIMGANTGPSRYGDPTGRKIDVMVIANCVALENDIFLEHVLYNTSAMLRQTGIDLWEEAARLAADPPAGWPRSRAVWDRLRSAGSPAKPLSETEPVDGFDADAFARRAHETSGTATARRSVRSMRKTCPSRVRRSASSKAAPHIGIMSANCAARSPTSPCGWTRSTGWATMRRAGSSPPGGARRAYIPARGSTAIRAGRPVRSGASPNGG